MRLSAALLLACLAPSALAQAPVSRIRPAVAPVAGSTPVQAIGPKQDDPRTAGIVVQGGRDQDCDSDADGVPEDRRALAIGPKQDDPRSPVGAAARPGDDEDPKAAGGTGALAIGPKQDDPGSRGIIVQGGLQDGSAGGVRGPGVLAIGPKQDDPRSPAAVGLKSPGVLAIGPKQDDPSRPGAAMGRPGDDEDPKARCMPRTR